MRPHERVEPHVGERFAQHRERARSSARAESEQTCRHQLVGNTCSGPLVRSECHRDEIDGVVVSHHPEFLDFLAPERAVELKRERNGPVRISPFPADDETELTPSEIVARG